MAEVTTNMDAPTLPFQDMTSIQSVAAVIAIMYTVRRAKVVCKPSLERLGAAAGVPKHNLGNFSMYCVRFTHRCMVGLLGVLALIQHPDFWIDTRLMWIGYPNHPTTDLVQGMYLLQLAYYVDDLVTIVLDTIHKEKKGLDFVMTLVHHSTTAHHVITIMLLALSSHYGFIRVGSVVSTLHVASDIPKDMAKISSKLGWKTATNASFALMLVTWAVTRLYWYPKLCIRSVLYETQPVYDVSSDPENLVYLHYLFLFLLGSIGILNYFWFLFLLKMLFENILKGDINDPTAKRE